jgi:hypothetical protein
MDENKPQDEDKMTPEKPDDNLGLNMSGHIVIKDKETGEELVNKRNAIHYGNMAYIVAQALNNRADAFVYYMAFGNGATSVDTAGRVVYKSPRVTESFESGASLYSRTYEKRVDAANNDDTSRVEVFVGPSYSDIKVTCTLNYGEPTQEQGAQPFDSTTNNEGPYVFDELALFSAPNPLSAGIETSTMLTHVIFHPVQKRLNRIIEVIYTVRVQLS